MFVYLDVVQFNKNGLQNRNQIKSSAGPTWLTLPVRHRLGQTICETQVADLKAFDKHAKTLAAAYGSAAGYRRWHRELLDYFSSRTSSLTEAAVDSTELLLERIGATGRRVRASELAGIHGSGSELVASICEALGATEYLSGRGGLTYMDRDDFKRIGCAVLLQEWRSPTYEQRFPDVGFVPDLSALDLILNCPGEARAVIDAAGGWGRAWEDT